MFPERLVHAAPELLRVFLQHARAFLKGKPHWAVAAFISGVAAGLVRKQRDFFIVVHGILQKVNDIAVIGYRKGLPFFKRFLGYGEGFLTAFSHLADPALAAARLDTGCVNLGDNPHAAGYFRRLGLGSAHTAEPR